MEGLRTQPDLHDLLQIEDDSLSPLDGTKDSTSPVRTAQNPLANSGKLTTPAKVLMVGEPVMVKTEQADDTAEDGDTTASAAEISGSSNEELADGINSPSPETAAAMESLMAADDLTSASPKLDEVPKLPVPVNFTSSNSSKVAVRPQTSIMASIRTSQPSSIAGRKFTVATQPVQVIKKDGGGPVMTKFIVKRTNTAAAASHKSPVVFTKGNRNTLTSSPVKSVSLQSGSIVLSPIKGGFKIPISPLKSPLKVSVIPPSNSKKLNLSTDKSFTIPINTSVPQLQLRTQAPASSGNVTVVNGLPTKATKTVVSQQPPHVFVQNRLVNTSSSQQQASNQTNQLLQQISMVPTQAAVQDPSGVKIQYVQLLSPNSGQPQVLRSNQGQPITFTSMAQLNGSGITLNQPSGPITLIQPGGVKFQPQASQSIQTQRKAHAVKVAIPQQPTIQPTQQQLKPQQRLIMPASAANLQPIRPNISVLPGGYAMVPAKYVEQLAKRFGSQQSFAQETSLQGMQKTIPSKIGSNGKLKKPCNCTKSQCLKLYCECFANGQFCDDCNCINCSNNLEHEVERSKAIKQCLERNPQAFRPKIGRGKDDNRTHQKGCNCKRSGCLKNYCECYEARIPCTSKCKCIGCKNYEESSDRRSLMSLADAAEVRVQQQTAAKSKLSSQIGEMRPNPRMTSSGERLPYTFFTQEVIEATCTCLLAQAEEAEKTNRPMVVAEAMILEEFGRCVMQIIQSAGKAKVPQMH